MKNCDTRWIAAGGCRTPPKSLSNDVTHACPLYSITISAEVQTLRSNALKDPIWTRRGEVHRPTTDWVSRMISQIGKSAEVVVQREDRARGKRTQYASAHDIRRGCAQRLINQGVSAETLKLVMRHKQFGTTERYYGATRAAQSAAAELYRKLDPERKNSGLVGGNTERPQFSAEELQKLKALLNSI